jgi:hypothetical protein
MILDEIYIENSKRIIHASDEACNITIKNEKFIDKKIINWINTTKFYRYFYTNGKISVNFYMESIDLANFEFINNHIALILMIYELFSKRINYQLYIKYNIFCSQYKKYLKPNEDKILGYKNINSGYTISPDKNFSEIVIFRKEELLKVLIHETIHAFHFDEDFFADSCSLKYFDGIKKSNYPFEAYTEYWAEIIYLKIMSLIKNIPYETLFKKELQWSKKNSDVICNMFDMQNYGEMSKIKQETAAYFYYIIKYLYMKYGMITSDIHEGKCSDINKNINFYMKNEFPDKININKIDFVKFTMTTYNNNIDEEIKKIYTQ